MHEQNVGIINYHDIQFGKNEVGDQFLYLSLIKLSNYCIIKYFT